MTAIRSKWDPLPTNPTLLSICIGAFVLGACIIGIHTRLLFSMASLWPANALLLSILLLRPEANRSLTWVVAAAAYMTADLLSGSEFGLSAILNGANLAGVAVGLLAAKLLPRGTLLLQRPMDSIYIVLTMAAASAAAGMAGILAGPLLFGMHWLRAFDLWFTTEFVNYAIFMPVLITLQMGHGADHMTVYGRRGIGWQQGAAVAALLVGLAVMHLSGGPGAMAFAIPALLWCAVCFPPAVSSALTLAMAAWLLIAGPTGHIPYHFDLSNAGDISSYRLGVAMIAIGPFAVAGLNMAWRVANEALEIAATRDELSGLLNRRAFMDLGHKALAHREARNFYLLMLDIDNFKTINDVHGHPAGDAVIQALGTMLEGSLRSGDFAARIGGEEFAIGMPATTPAAAEALAERLRLAISQLIVTDPFGTDLRLTASIGVAGHHGCADLSSILSAADSALYVAKRGGRDRVVTAFHGPSGEGIHAAPHPHPLVMTAG